MSKIVTIPTDGMNPFVVTHNGEKYVFTPGETVEVSDGVALEIEEYKRWREKYYGTIDPPYEGGGEIEALTVSENGTYTPPEGVDGYAPVTVNVVPPASDIDALIDGSLTEITSNAESVRSEAFLGNTWVTKIDLPKALKINNDAFENCTNLMNVNIPSATTIGGEVFKYCKKLVSVNAPLVETIKQYAFNMCVLIESVKFPSLTVVDQFCFSRADELKKADFSKVQKINNNAFNSCYSFRTLILRSETMCNLGGSAAFSYCYRFRGTVDATYNPDGLKGYIYVPRALIDSYKTATNWVTFADQFRALEDYTVDGTTTGELDESKVSL